MHYFIDGYNLLFFHLKPDASLQKKREELIEILDEKFKLLKDDVTVVFDGFNTLEKTPQRQYFQSLKIVFTPKGQTADEYILEQLQHLKNPSHITVVTADKNLAQKVRYMRAHTKTPKAFLLLAAKKESEKISANEKLFEESKIQIERLLHLFEKRLRENDLDNF